MPILLPTINQSPKLKLVARVDGIPLYSGPKFQELLYNVDQKYYPSMKKDFKEAIYNTKRLIPCIVNSKGFWRKLSLILGWGVYMSAGTVGFYDVNRKKVYLILSSMTGFLTLYSNYHVLGVQCHEFQHVACHLSPQAAAYAWRVEEQWYHVFLIKAVELGRLEHGAVRALMPLFKMLNKAEARGRSFQQAYLIFKTLANFAPEPWIANNFLKIGNALRQGKWLIRADEWLYLYFFEAASYAYHNLIQEYHLTRYTDPDVSMYYQELFAPSEIVAMMASIDFKNPISVKIMHYGLDALNKA